MVQVLNYCAMHTDAAIWYKQSAIVIAIHRDASYLYNSKVRIWSGGHFFFKKNQNRANLWLTM